MRYLNPLVFALANLGWSLVPGNPVAWINALVFFGSLALLVSTATFDALEWAFGRAKP